MKLWRCEGCGKEKFSKEEDTIIKICYVCQIDMREVENELKTI